PRPGRGDGGRGVAARGQHEDRVEGVRDQVLPPLVVRGDVVLTRARFSYLWRQVADRRDLVAVGQLAKVVEVHDLGDQAAADHADPQSVSHRGSPTSNSGLERSTGS